MIPEPTTPARRQRCPQRLLPAVRCLSVGVFACRGSLPQLSIGENQCVSEDGEPLGDDSVVDPATRASSRSAGTRLMEHLQVMATVGCESTDGLEQSGTTHAWAPGWAG